MASICAKFEPNRGFWHLTASLALFKLFLIFCSFFRTKDTQIAGRRETPPHGGKLLSYLFEIGMPPDSFFMFDVAHSFHTKLLEFFF